MVPPINRPTRRIPKATFKLLRGNIHSSEILNWLIFVSGTTKESQNRDKLAQFSVEMIKVRLKQIPGATQQCNIKLAFARLKKAPNGSFTDKTRKSLCSNKVPGNGKEVRLIYISKSLCFAGQGRAEFSINAVRILKRCSWERKEKTCPDNNDRKAKIIENAENKEKSERGKSR